MSDIKVVPRSVLSVTDSPNVKMIFTPLIVATVFAVANAATTVTMPPSTMMPEATTAMAAKILYDSKHHKAMIVRADGCYEYHMNHQDSVDSQNDATRPALEKRMLEELASAINIQETGHHHIDHMTQDIQTACSSLPVYSFEIAN